MNRKVGFAALGIMVALLLAACQFNATTRVDPSGSGEFRNEIGFSADERRNLEEQSDGTNAGNFCNIPAEQGQVPSDITVTEEMRGDQTWCVTTTQFDNLDELKALYERNQSITVNRLELSGGRLYYDVSINLDRDDDSSFANYESATWQVVLPGEVVSHNANNAQSNTISWQLTPDAGMVNLQAESTVPTTGPNIMLLGVVAAVIAAIVLAALVAVAVWLKRPR
jgi:hypothetical protein